MTTTNTITEDHFIRVFTAFADAAHANSRAKKFWDTRDAIVRACSEVSEELGMAARKCVDSQNRELMHSELSEACEGARKNLMDDKCPQFEMEVVELADCVIRIIDHAAARKLPIAEAIIAKMRMNEGREAMHGGKLF